MSKTRQPWPDGPVTVRTYPITFLRDRVEHRHDVGWHVLTYALQGHLEVMTGEMRRIVPVDRAVWVPAGTAHTVVMHAPIAMRSLFVAPAAVVPSPRVARVRTIAVAPLLRQLILHITTLGALDRRRPQQARLASVLIDQLVAAEDVAIELLSPRDDRARRFADLVVSNPSDHRSLAALARASGASLRTLERCFHAETGVSVGEWRRRVRLFHALRLLSAGGTVTNVAGDVGYSSTSAFCQAFAQQFGYSPGRHAVHGRG